MSAKPTKTATVRVGSVVLHVVPHAKGWRWSWKDSDGKWRYGTRLDYSDAMDAAKDQARAISNGRVDLSTLDPVRADLVRQFLALEPTSADLDRMREWRARPASVSVTTALQRWYAHKLAELGGVESRTLRENWKWLEKFALHFAERNAPDISTDELQTYIEAASTNPKSRREYRTKIATLWKFANAHEIFSSTACARLPAYKLGPQRRIDILTPANAKLVLANVLPEYRGWAVLNMFSGLRAQEIVSRRKVAKPSLRWEHVRRADGVIDVPARVSKRRKRRIVPITPTLAAWLDYIDAPESGEIAPRDPSRGETARLGAMIGGWPRNVLRHTYGSYRAAQTKNAPALALEMGNSVSVIEAFYLEAVSAADAATFWGLTPAVVFDVKKD